ncbi:MAG: glycosyltransferase family 4 protein [Myxococcales bacterium]|nr:glycosyltransferase family 4 protein [Myxococcales bacterium]
MRLTLVSQDYPPSFGGVQSWCLGILQGLIALGHRVTVLAPEQPGSSQIDRRAPWRVLRVPCLTTNRFPLAITPVFLRLLWEERPDAVVHAQWPGASTVVRLPRRPPVFVVTHGRELLWTPPEPLARAYRWLRASTLQRADAVISVSRFTRELALNLKVLPHRVHVLPNGTDPEKFSPGEPSSRLREYLNAEGRPVVLTVARLVERKGIDVTLRSIRILRTTHTDLLYIVAGDGPDRGRLEGLVARLGLEKNVRFLGTVSEETLLDLYRLANVFVMMSRSEGFDVEGFGVALLEANACGKAVIGAREGGIPDAIEDEVTGLLVPPRDEHALAAALGRLLNDPKLRERLGHAGRAKVVEARSWHHTAAGLVRILEDRLGSYRVLRPRSGPWPC